MRTALFSVSYAGLWGQARLDVSAFAARAKALGYDGVMLMGKRPHAYPWDLDKDERLRLRKALEDNEMTLACVAGYTNFTAGMESLEVPLVDLQVQYVAELARLTSDLGGTLVRVFTGYEIEGSDPEPLWKRSVQGLQASADAAADFGVTLGVQNHHGLGLHTDALLEFLGEVDRPNVRAMFDAWSPALRGEDLYDAAKRMAPHTVATTCADYVRLPRYAYEPGLINYRRLEPDLVRAVPMGEGCIDYRAFFRGLRDGGFDGWVNFEMCSPTRGGGAEENLDRYAQRFLEFMAGLEA